MYDAIIIGAGPAGATLARKLSKDGYSVLLIEKCKLPKYKACGGGITGRCYKLIDLDIGELIEDITYKLEFIFDNKNSITIESKEPVIYQVDRMKFDHYLTIKAVESGTELHTEEKFNDFEYVDDYVLVKTNKSIYKGRILVGADGINSIVARKAGIVNGKKGIALEAEIYSDKSFIAEKSGKVCVDFSVIKGGYGWIFPKENRLAVGVGTFNNKAVDIKEKLNGFINKFIDSKVKIEVYGHPLAYPNGENGKYNNERVILIGDAMMLADPFTGEGIYNAVLTANIAYEVISSKIEGNVELNEFTKKINSEIIPDIMWAYKLSLFAYNNMPLIYQAVKLFPSTLAYFIDMMNGNDNYIKWNFKVPACALHLKKPKSKIKVI